MNIRAYLLAGLSLPIALGDLGFAVAARPTEAPAIVLAQNNDECPPDSECARRENRRERQRERRRARQQQEQQNEQAAPEAPQAEEQNNRRERQRARRRERQQQEQQQEGQQQEQAAPAEPQAEEQNNRRERQRARRRERQQQEQQQPEQQQEQAAPAEPQAEEQNNRRERQRARRRERQQQEQQQEGQQQEQADQDRAREERQRNRARRREQQQELSAEERAARQERAEERGRRSAERQRQRDIERRANRQEVRRERNERDSATERQLEAQGDRREADRVRELRAKLREERRRLRNLRQDERAEDRVERREDQAERREDRAERREDGRGRILERRGDRIVVDLGGGRIVVRPEFDYESERLLYGARDVEVIELPNGRTRTIVYRDDGTQIITVRNRYGDIVRRVRRYPDEREIVLIEDIYFEREAPVFYEPIVLPPLIVNVPDDEYIVDYSVASPEEIQDVLIAPPVEAVERAYSVEEVRTNVRVRDKMSRIDLDRITFEFGSATIGVDQTEALEELGFAMEEVIAESPEEVYLIEGHTDAVGSDADNLLLSDDRAEAVAVALAQNFEIPPENLVTEGYGEAYLKIPTEAAERENRRVTVRRITPLLTAEASPAETAQ